MTALTTKEMYNIYGGKTLTCRFCGQTFKDKKILWFTYSYAETQLNQHYSICKQAKKKIYGYY